MLTYQSIEILLKMTNNTCSDPTFGGAWYNRMVAKKEDSHSAAPADKPINKMLQSTTPQINQKHPI